MQTTIVTLYGVRIVTIVAGDFDEDIHDGLFRQQNHLFLMCQSDIFPPLSSASLRAATASSSLSNTPR